MVLYHTKKLDNFQYNKYGILKISIFFPWQLKQPWTIFLCRFQKYISKSFYQNQHYLLIEEVSGLFN